MIDYKELIAELRDRNNEDRYKRLTLEAADAIDRLQYQLEKYHERVVYLEEMFKELPEWKVTIH